MREELTRFLKSGQPADARVFFETLVASNNKTDIETICSAISNTSAVSETDIRKPSFALPQRFSMLILFLLSELQLSGKDPLCDVLFGSQRNTPEEAFGAWTTCKNKNSYKDCPNAFMAKMEEQFRRGEIEDLENKFNSTINSEEKKHFKNLMAIRAYISLKEYLGQVNVTDLETRAKSTFGFFSKDQLGVDTYSKDKVLHFEISQYFQAPKHGV